MEKTAVEPYESNLDAIGGMLSVLDMRLARRVQQLRQKASSGLSDQFRGLFVADGQAEEIVSLMVRGLSQQADEVDPPLSLIAKTEREVRARTQASVGQETPLRLEQVRDLFRLDSWDVDVIVLCLTIEIDLRYEILYAYVQDDIGKKQPTVGLALGLLCEDGAEQIAYRRRFLNPSPLISWGLVHVAEPTYGNGTSFLTCPLRLDAAIVSFLLESDSVDERLRGLSRLVDPSASWADLLLSAELKTRFAALVTSLRPRSAEDIGVVLQLVGPAGIGKKMAAEAICTEMRKSLLIVDVAGFLASDLPPRNLTTMLMREALLCDALLYVDGFHLLTGDDPQARTVRTAIVQSLQDHHDLVFLGTETAWCGDGSLGDRKLITVDLPRPGYTERRQLWASYLNGQGDIAEEDLSSLATGFRFTGGQIGQAVSTATNLARWRSWDTGRPTLEDLRSASRLHSNQRLALLAHKVQGRYSWDDIVLPPDQKAQLGEISGFFRNMPLVYDEWGFQYKSSLGKGLNILFAGPSGTGKTMAAEIIASELGLDLYKIDLSEIVSKYIGETEKNLDRIFREARDSNAILFFDEADAVFGKRSEVKDSHDRYANIEISYLLQKMEEYDGIVVLATNLRKNIDEAFVRRMHFAIEFPFPEEEYRLQIWERVFPDEAPLDDGVDLSFLARRFKVAGGNIKNIAVASAFLAAEETNPIGMGHVIWATKREYQKMGKLLVESDFGPYFGMVRA